MTTFIVVNMRNITPISPSLCLVLLKKLLIKKNIFTYYKRTVFFVKIKANIDYKS